MYTYYSFIAIKATGKISLLDYRSFSIPMSFDRRILKAEKVEMHGIRG